MFRVYFRDDNFAKHTLYIHSYTTYACVCVHVSPAHRPFASCKEGLLLFYYGTGLCQYIAIANEGEVEYTCVNGAMDLSDRPVAKYCA